MQTKESQTTKNRKTRNETTKRLRSTLLALATWYRAHNYGDTIEVTCTIYLQSIGEQNKLKDKKNGILREVALSKQYFGMKVSSNSSPTRLSPTK